MLDTDSLYAAERMEFGSHEDIPHRWMEAQLFKTIYQLLSDALEDDDDIIEDMIMDLGDDLGVNYRSLDEFRLEHLFDELTQELNDCAGYEKCYVATVVRSHADPDYKAVVYRTFSGNPMGRVFYGEENEVAFDYYDGSVNTWQLPEEKHGEAQALSVLTTEELGMSIADWKKTPGGIQNLEYLSAL